MDRQNWVASGGEEELGSDASVSLREEQDAHGQAVSQSSTGASLTREDLDEALALAGLGVWRWGIGSEEFQWSAEIFRITGRDPRTFVPTLGAALKCIHPDDQANVRQKLLVAGKSERSEAGEFRVIRLDNSERYCSAKISRVTRGGRIVALRGVLFDITEQRESELAVQATQEWYRDTVELSPQMPWTADRSGNILTVSGRWNAMTGLPEEAALGTGWLNQLHLDDLPPLKSSIAASMAECKPLDVKARLKCGNGELRWIRARAFPKLDAAGQVIRWYGLTEDVHEQEQAVASLRESEEHYRYTLELNPQVPWTADPKGNILEAGPRWFKLVGSTPQEWLTALHPDDFTPTVERWSHALERGEPLDARYRLRMVDGCYRWFRVRAAARYSAEGVIIRWYGLLEDIHDQVIAERALQEREEWIRQAHEAAGVGLFEVDFDSGCSKLSPQSLVLHERPRDSAEIFPGGSWAQLVRAEDGPQAWAAVAHSVATGETYDVTFGVPLENGKVRWINGLGSVQYHSDGRPHRLLGINFDVTARRAVDAALQRSEALNRSIVDASPDGIKLITPSGEVIFTNQTCFSGMEIEPDVPLVGRNWIDLWPASAQSRARNAIATAVRGEIGRFVAPRATARGRPKWWDVVVSPVLSDSAEPRRLVTIARDITEQKAAEDRIVWGATHDPLTRLANRRLLDEQLVEALSEAEAGGEGLAVFMLDLDRFKQINDTLGHDAGDAVLRAVADRLQSILRASDTVARLGGDEFALILRGISDPIQVATLADDILIRLREPVVYAGASLDCRASIGASIYPQHGTSPGDLLKHADIALYAAKVNQRGELLIFAPHMRAELQERVSMISTARSALREHRIRPFYQPKVDLGTGRVVGFEALARWNDAKGIVHLPATIAAAFNEWDVSTAITERMLDEVLEQMRVWRNEGVLFGHVALNASAADFQRPDFADHVLGQLHRVGVPADNLQIEVTETVFLARAADVVERTLGQLSNEGVTIALDDFGTGYASLSHLNQFPVDVIKIDRSFVSGLNDNGHLAAIVEAVVTLGRRLGLEVVAEGVETSGQARRLADLGCSHAQGFLFSAAIPAYEVPNISNLRFDL